MKIQAGTTNKYFNLNGLDYPKGVYKPFFRDKQIDESGQINEVVLKVGLNSIIDGEQLAEPVNVTSWLDSSGNPYTSLTDLITDLGNLLGINESSGGGGTGIQSIQEGDNISIDNTDPQNPIVSANGFMTLNSSNIVTENWGLYTTTFVDRYGYIMPSDNGGISFGYGDDTNPSEPSLFVINLKKDNLSFIYANGEGKEFNIKHDGSLRYGVRDMPLDNIWTIAKPDTDTEVSFLLLPQTENEIERRLTLSVNGEFADENGNIVIPNPPTPTLSEVLAEGNVADRDIEFPVGLGSSSFLGKGDLETIAFIVPTLYRKENDVLQSVNLFGFNTIDETDNMSLTQTWKNEVTGTLGSGFTINSSEYLVDEFFGISASHYYGANYDDNTYVQKKYVDDNFLPLPTEGTSGQVLTTDGAGEYTWQTAPGSGVTWEYVYNYADLVTAIASNDVIRIAPVTITVESTLVIPSGKTILGAGVKSKLKADTGVDVLIDLTNSTNVILSDFSIEGNGANVNPSSTAIINTSLDALTNVNIGTQIGVLIDKSDGSKLNNLTISNFNNSGVQISYVGINGGFSRGVKLSNLLIEHCYNGIYTLNTGEYSQISNVSTLLCVIGIQIRSGNVVVSNSQFTNNRIGAFVGNGSNNGHGSFTGCLFNHNKLRSVLVHGLANGHAFSNCQAFDGDMEIWNTKGFNWVGGEIACGIIHTSQASAKNGISNTVFLKSYNGGTITNSGAGAITLKNNFFIDNSDSTSINN